MTHYETLHLAEALRALEAEAFDPALLRAMPRLLAEACPEAMAAIEAAAERYFLRMLESA